MHDRIMKEIVEMIDKHLASGEELVGDIIRLTAILEDEDSEQAEQMERYLYRLLKAHDMVFELHQEVHRY